MLSWLFAFLIFLEGLSHCALAGETLSSLDKELQSLIDSTKQSVMTVTATFSQVVIEEGAGLFPFFRTPSGKRPVTFTNIGTGVVFDQLGHVITRSSIVTGAESIMLTMADGRQFQADFVGHDYATGIAVLKTGALNLQPMAFSSADEILPGSFSVIIGNSLGVYPSVALGMVNGLRNDGLLQVSASLLPGNNGSPLISLNGELIGLLAGQLNSNPGFFIPSMVFQNNATVVAYPVGWIKRIGEDLIELGYVRKGWLGIVGAHEGPHPEIGEIRPDSPAQKAGLVAGDIILKFSHKDVNSISELARVVEFTVPGTRIQIEYMRGSLHAETTVAVGEKSREDWPENSWNRVEGVPIMDAGNQEESGAAPARMQLERRLNQLELELLELRKLIARHPK